MKKHLIFWGMLLLGGFAVSYAQTEFYAIATAGYSFVSRFPDHYDFYDTKHARPVWNAALGGGLEFGGNLRAALELKGAYYYSKLVMERRRDNVLYHVVQREKAWGAEGLVAIKTYKDFWLKTGIAYIPFRHGDYVYTIYENGNEIYRDESTVLEDWLYPAAWGLFGVRYRYGFLMFDLTWYQAPSWPMLNLAVTYRLSLRGSE
ncbi:MAG: hypothetical protein GXO27_01595 [Chlorobi bacterium]|nr:hypothetical protein [Chlorobiota bacterium]